ncbi:dual specificity protein phosphatase family protein [Photobacterium lipolyticum]|uniref:Phosphatase n=1 Tax=Photobacterium lipolyticum TaxID=266810 RepID=A0A2T3N3Z8_9GAMM|nr:dual specificity protein phosphatase family protein [Photobacterium lipolyticum]PSW07173.1 phosphatase [Photobacterium lipolyticum]
MSNTHPFWPLALNNGAQLLLTPCPGTKEADLHDSLVQLKAAGAIAVLTGLQPSDLPSDGLQKLTQECEALGLKWYHLPIEDDCAPGEEFNANWPEVSQAAQNMLDNGDSLAIHCMGGSGRTGLIAAHLMLERGMDLEAIISQIQALRPGAFTREAHIDYIQAFESK